MPGLGFPLVNGMTETSADSEPLHVKLMALLSERPGAARSNISDALDLLQEAYGLEANSDVKDRLACSIAVLSGAKSPKYGDE